MNEKKQIGWIKEMMIAYQRPLVGYTTGIVGDVGRAQDIVQEAYLKLWKAGYNKINPNEKSWLYTVCRNHAFDSLKREKRMMPTAELSDKPDLGAISAAENSEKEDQIAEMLNALDGLPQKQREIVEMKFQYELSYKEISNITGLSTSNIGYIIYQGMTMLRKKLSTDGKTASKAQGGRGQ